MALEPERRALRRREPDEPGVDEFLAWIRNGRRRYVELGGRETLGFGLFLFENHPDRGMGGRPLPPSALRLDPYGPTMMFPAARTGPASGAEGSRVAGDPHPADHDVPLNSMPPFLPVIRSGPTIVFAAHGPVARSRR